VSFSIEIKHGKLSLNQLELPAIGKNKIKTIKIKLNGVEPEAQKKFIKNMLVLNFTKNIELDENSKLEIIN